MNAQAESDLVFQALAKLCRPGESIATLDLGADFVGCWTACGEVIVRMRARGYGVLIEDHSPTHWAERGELEPERRYYARFDSRKPNGYVRREAFGATIPEAVCRAALLTLEWIEENGEGGTA